MQLKPEIILTTIIFLIILLLLTMGSIEARTTVTRHTDIQQVMTPICEPHDSRYAISYTNSYSDTYDPLAKAIASIGQTRNFEASVPSQCYTKTDGEANPCWTCHTGSQGMNFQGDWELQEEYAFSDMAMTNHWTNLFKDRSEVIASISDVEMEAYIKMDNYTALREYLETAEDYPGYVPDLDLERGFDQQGFARDGSGWRAIRYKPFLGTFWPTNGNTDDVMMRLPLPFRSDALTKPSQEIYKINLAILEAAITTNPWLRSEEVEREVEPVSELVAGLDLNGDGRLSESVTWIRGLPSHYVGAAKNIPVTRYLFPKGTEFLHTVRYVDMDNPSLLSTRLKELRYSRKVQMLDTWAISRNYEKEGNEKDDGKLPVYTGSPLVGLRNNFGWQLQGFIEDAQGRLRLQTEEEHRFCMGCHSAVGVTVDQTFTLARKVPGAEGWRYQYLAGIPDVPQLGHDKPEYLTYFERVTGGDEFRANDEILERFFPGGTLDEEEVLRAAPGGDKDITYLITPSRERAALLNKAYMALVREQTFDLGRDTIISPPANVHKHIENAPTDLSEVDKIFLDGTLWLDWNWQPANR